MSLISSLLTTPAQPQASDDNQDRFWQLLGIGGIITAVVQGIWAQKQKGDRFDVQQDISGTINPLERDVQAMKTQIITINTMLTEQEKEDSRIRDFVKVEVRGLGDRLEGKINQTHKELEEEKVRTDRILEKLDKTTDEIHTIALNIAKMTQALMYLQDNQPKQGKDIL